MDINDITLENIEEYNNIKNIDDIKLSTEQYTFCRKEAREKQNHESLQNTHFNESVHFGTDASGFKLYNKECIERFKSPIMDQIRNLRREKNRMSKISKNLPVVIKPTLPSDLSATSDELDVDVDEDVEMKNRLNLYIIITIFFIILFSILYSNSFDIDKDNKKIMTTYSYIYLTILILSIISFLVVLGLIIFKNI